MDGLARRWPSFMMRAKSSPQSLFQVVLQLLYSLLGLLLECSQLVVLILQSLDFLLVLLPELGVLVFLHAEEVLYFQHAFLECLAAVEVTQFSLFQLVDGFLQVPLKHSYFFSKVIVFLLYFLDLFTQLFRVLVLRFFFYFFWFERFQLFLEAENSFLHESESGDFNELQR